MASLFMLFHVNGGGELLCFLSINKLNYGTLEKTAPRLETSPLLPRIKQIVITFVSKLWQKLYFQNKAKREPLLIGQDNFQYRQGFRVSHLIK